MQLDNQKSVRPALVAITASLLGAGAVASAGQGKVESSVLLYSETDRVKAAEAVAAVSWSLPSGRVITGKFTFDALTGATPNGGVPSNGIQSFTRPSGRGQYTVAPGETPLDDTFHDTRMALDASLSQPIGRMTTLSFGGHFSGEYDYQSIGANIGFSRDFNRRNTTLELSGALSFDKIRPEGGIPIPFATMPTTLGSLNREGESDSKTVVDVVFGVTQILDRKTIAQLNYSFSRASGYLTDPFKILSIVDDPNAPNPGMPLSYVYESRPDSRTKHALYVHGRRYLGGNIIDGSYRFYTDDWGMGSHTIDLFYRQRLGGLHAIQPHVRWYHQSSTDFHKTFLVNGEPLPEFASADYRLAAFDAYTLGIQYFFPVMDRARMSVTGEYYSQLGDKSPPEAFGALRDVDLFPNMGVFMFRLGCTYDL